MSNTNKTFYIDFGAEKYYQEIEVPVNQDFDLRNSFRTMGIAAIKHQKLYSTGKTTRSKGLNFYQQVVQDGKLVTHYVITLVFDLPQKPEMTVVEFGEELRKMIIQLPSQFHSFFHAQIQNLPESSCEVTLESAQAIQSKLLTAINEFSSAFLVANCIFPAKKTIDVA